MNLNTKEGELVPRHTSSGQIKFVDQGPVGFQGVLDVFSKAITCGDYYASLGLALPSTQALIDNEIIFLNGYKQLIDILFSQGGAIFPNGEVVEAPEIAPVNQEGRDLWMGMTPIHRVTPYFKGFEEDLANFRPTQRILIVRPGCGRFLGYRVSGNGLQDFIWVELLMTNIHTGNLY